jgi:hypothetical protein
MYGLVFLLQCSFSASSTKPLQDLGFRVSQQICRKDVMSARDDREWRAIAVSRSITREGPVAGAEKKKLNLEEELKVWMPVLVLCHLSLSSKIQYAIQIVPSICHHP